MDTEEASVFVNYPNDCQVNVIITKTHTNAYEVRVMIREITVSRMLWTS
jgi:hypothetical protein